MKNVFLQLDGFHLGENSALDFAVASLLFIGIFFVLRLLVSMSIIKIEKRIGLKKTRITPLLNILKAISVSAYATTGLYISAQYLRLPAMVEGIIFVLFFITMMAQCIWLAEQVTLILIRRFWLRERNEDTDTLSSILAFLVRAILWVAGLLMLLSNIGVDITSLLTSLGIVGVAIALAVQNILGDLLSSFSIYIDRPFRVGDYIVAGDHMGIVKRIGLKTTRLQALRGEEIVIPNRELTSTRIRNFKRMSRRRIEFLVCIAKNTSASQLEKTLKTIHKIIESEPELHVERVKFKEILEAGFIIEVIYNIQTADHAIFMDYQEKINLAILKSFEQDEIKLVSLKVE